MRKLDGVTAMQNRKSTCSVRRICWEGYVMKVLFSPDEQALVFTGVPCKASCRQIVSENGLGHNTISLHTSFMGSAELHYKSYPSLLAYPPTPNILSCHTHQSCLRIVFITYNKLPSPTSDEEFGYFFLVLPYRTMMQV